MYKWTLLFTLSVYCLLLSSCKMTVVYEPLPPRGDAAVLVDADAQSTHAVGEEVESTKLIANMKQLSVSNYKIGSLGELEDELLGERWIAFARVLSKPYTSVDLKEYAIYDSWIAITPNPQPLDLSLVSLVNTEGAIYSIRHIVKTIPLTSNTFEALDAFTKNAYPITTSTSVLWITDVYIEDSKTVFSIIPSLPSTLARAPYDLNCDLTDPNAVKVRCELTSRFDPQTVTPYSGTLTTTTDINIDLLAKAPDDSQRIDYGECDEFQKLCILKSYGGQTDPETVQKIMCVDILQCHIDNTNQSCQVWACSQVLGSG